MRVLVLDGSRVLFFLVQRLVPEEVEVIYTSSFEEAVVKIEDHTADAVIADLTPANLPWRRFQKLCCEQQPQIPVLFQSCAASRVEETKLRQLCGCNRFISKPYHADELRVEVFRVLENLEHSEHLKSGADQGKPLPAVH